MVHYMGNKELPMILLNFRGIKISKTLDTVDQFKRCLEFLYDDEDYRNSLIENVKINEGIN